MSLALAAARFLTRVAAILLIAMVAVNVLDVGLRSGFNAPIFGTYEIVELFLAGVAFLAIPEAFLRGRHITIELIDQIVPPRGVELLKLTGVAASVVFTGLLAFHMVEPAVEFVEFDEVTADLQYPVIWKASLVLAGVAASFLAATAVFLRDMRATLRRRDSA